MKSADFVATVSIFLGPVISGIAAIFLVWLTREKMVTWVMASLFFLLSAVVGFILNYIYLFINGHLFSGDSGLIILVQPVMSVIFITPVALIFFICLLIVVRKNTHMSSRGDR